MDRRAPSASGGAADGRGYGMAGERRRPDERGSAQTAGQWTSTARDRSPGRAGPSVALDRSLASSTLVQPGQGASLLRPYQRSPQDPPLADVRRSPSMSSATGHYGAPSSTSAYLQLVADAAVTRPDSRGLASIDPYQPSYASSRRDYPAPSRPQPMATPAPLPPATPRGSHERSFPPFTGDPSPLFDHRHDFDACVSPRTGVYPDFERPLERTPRPMRAASTYDGGSIWSGGTSGAWSPSPPGPDAPPPLRRPSARDAPVDRPSFRDLPVAETRPASRDRRFDLTYDVGPPSSRKGDNPWAEPESRWTPTGPISPRRVGSYGPASRPPYDPGPAHARDYGFAPRR